MEYTDEMLGWFNSRTGKHISRVVSWYGKVSAYTGLELIDIEAHDASKFREPEHTPYVFTTWNYYCRRNNIPFTIPEDMQERAHAATISHITSNKHHPEFWDDGFDESKFNKADRDAVPDEMVDATAMPLEYVSEMVADWFAVSEEFSSEPRIWADKNVNKRWRFTEEQVEFIYDLIKNVWELQDEK